MSTVYHLEAKTPFHFGSKGVGLEATTEFARSDTLFSALCYGLQRLGGTKLLEDFLAEYSASNNEPPLQLTSAFPYVYKRQEGDSAEWQGPGEFEPNAVVRFFPRVSDWPAGSDEKFEAKQIKKITWVSEQIFRQWVSGNALGEHMCDDLIVQGGRVWLTSEELDAIAGWRDPETDQIQLWAVDDAPRVTIDRIRNASAVYQAGRVWFQPGGGLWAMLKWRSDWQKQGETALHLLGDAGIGGERSSGHGQFTAHGPHTIEELPTPKLAERFVTLSLYYPTVSEARPAMQGEDVSYRFELRGGWMSSQEYAQNQSGDFVNGSTLCRKVVRMFTEGSILHYPSDNHVLGQLADVTPETFKEIHPVYRYGLAWPVGYYGYKEQEAAA